MTTIARNGLRFIEVAPSRWDNTPSLRLMDPFLGSRKKNGVAVSPLPGGSQRRGEGGVKVAHRLSVGLNAGLGRATSCCALTVKVMRIRVNFCSLSKSSGITQT